MATAVTHDTYTDQPLPAAPWAPPRAKASSLPFAERDGRSRSLVRAFSIISFVAVVIAGALLALCYRYVAIHSILAQSEAANMVTAEAALGDRRQDIAELLARWPYVSPPPLPAALAVGLRELAEGATVRQVSIYNAHGIVVFSTRPGETGNNAADRPAVMAALGGQPSSRMDYRDVFNSFAFGEARDDNLAQTCLPLREFPFGPVLGVVEIHTDVSSLVASQERAQVVVAVTATTVMLLLYASLLMVVRRIGRVIDVQQDTLRERSELLAVLSTEMMNNQEEEKQRIAAELHERVAQTLAAVKLTVEGAAAQVRPRDPDAAAQLQAIVPPMQAAIQEVRSAAANLRPASLDDLGLLATLRWLCREFAEDHPTVAFEPHFALSEDDVPPPLRPIIFRAVEDACMAVASVSAVSRLQLSLDADEERVVLTLQDDGLAAAADDPEHPYARLRDRTLLSGGKFAARPGVGRGLLVTATWLR